MRTPTTAPRTRGMIKAAAFTAAQINHTNQITPHEAQVMLSILTRHDAGTLAPEIPFKDREPVSRMFDKLRFHLGTIVDKEVTT